MLALLTAAPAQAGENIAHEDILVTGPSGKGPTCDAAASKAGIDYLCLNWQLKSAAGAGRPAPARTETIGREVTTPSKVGTFSFAATAQRMGQNFGKSAQPYRPPAPVYSSAYTKSGRAAGPR